MKAENIITTPSGYVKCTLNGIKIEGTLDQVNAILYANDCEPLKLKPQHWSSTKRCWVNIEDMNYRHIENHIEKEWACGELIVENIRKNHYNFRDYIKQLIKHYEKNL